MKILAQETSFHPEFRVSEKDLVTNTYAKDSLASALVIYESGNSYIEQSEYSVVTKYKKKIKILKPEGFQYASVKIYLYQGENRYESVRNIEAISYTKENGKVSVVKMEESQIFKEDVNDRYSTVTFTLPNIKVGTVITYSYTLISPFIYNFHDWEFQSTIPKVYSEYVTKIPANYNYNIKLVGLKKLDEKKSEIERECFSYGTAKADCTKSYYLMKDIPAFVEEKFMTTKKNYLSKIAYELMQVKYFDGRVDNITKKWKDADHELKTTSLGKALRKSSATKNLLSQDLIMVADPLEKAKAIFEYVQNKYVWDNDYYLFTNVSVKRIIEDKSGNIGSLNSLLHNLLKSNGIEVYPIILSTRENGLPTKLFPVLSEFNYLIVKVSIGGKEYLLDASDKFVSFGQLPFRCLNTYGRQIDFKNGSSWVSLEHKNNSMSYLSFDLKFKNATSLQGVMKTGYSGYHALDKKKEYCPNPNAYENKLQDQLEGFEIASYIFKSSGVDDSKFQEEVQLEKEFDMVKNSGIYLDPFFFKFFNQNPFKLQYRTYPVDFGYKDSYIYKLKLDVGEFYEIGAIPEDIHVSLPDRKGGVACSTTKVGSVLNISFKIDFRESKYEPYFYEGLKKIMEKIVYTQLNSIVVLDKK